MVDWTSQIPGMRRWMLVGVLGVLAINAFAEFPDIDTVAADLIVPELTEEKAAPGKRLKQTLAEYRGTEVYHVLYLPTDWEPGASYPVLVEFAGNGPYRNRRGDVSTGFVEGSKMGFGISGGEGFIWLCLPYLDTEGAANVRQWWGNAPDYDVRPTLRYCRRAIDWICADFGGDRKKIVLCGFSRGAIACNFIGLHNDEIAKTWRAFVPYSHYDGVHTGWPYPGSDRASALERLRRLGDRPQFICGEGDDAARTRAYLRDTGVRGNFTIRATGFRNHDDAWLLRPSPVRAELRQWLKEALAD